MGTMTRKEIKRAQQRADLALPIASDLTGSERRARRKKARASQTTAKAKTKAKTARAKPKPKKRDRSVFGIAKLLKKRGKLPK